MFRSSSKGGRPAWDFIDGNALLCLFTDFYFSRLRESGRLPENPLVLTSVVTSPLHRIVAEAQGAEVRETLTGFKWMASYLHEEQLRAPQVSRFVLAGEESHGILVGNSMRDKDGVLAACLVSEMLASFHRQGLGIPEALALLYTKYACIRDLTGSVSIQPGTTDPSKLLLQLESDLPSRLPNSVSVL
jgi:phosphoglucomutase